MEKEYEQLLKLTDALDELEGKKQSAERDIKIIKKKIEAVRKDIVTYFQATGLVNDEYQQGDIKLKFKLTKPQGRLIVDDIDKLPKQFVSYEPKVNKTNLKEYMKEHKVQGVSFEYGEPNVTWSLVK